MKLLDQLSPNEKVLWSGKKAKSVSFFESIFNPLMPFALLWALIDGFIIYAIAHAENADDFSSSGFPVIGFFAIHLLPVWIYLAGILASASQAKHTEYCITEKGVYVQSGVFSTNVIMKPFSDMHSVTVKQSLFDRLFKTGDVIMECGSVVYPKENGRTVRNSHGLLIENISDYESVLRLLQDRQAAAAAEAAAEQSGENTFRGQFSAQIAPAGTGMQSAESFQQAQFARQQAEIAQQQFRQSAFGQPAAQQPMFSDPQRGFSATSGSFFADGIPGMQPQGFPEPAAAPQRNFIQQPFSAPQPSASVPQFTAPVPQPSASVSQFTTPAPQQSFMRQPASAAAPNGFDMPKGFEMPDLTVPEPPQPDFVDPTLAHAQDFRDPTLDYLDPNRPI